MVVDGSGDALVEGKHVNGEIRGEVSDATTFFASSGVVRMCGAAERGVWHGMVEEFSESGVVVHRGVYEEGSRIVRGMLAVLDEDSPAKSSNAVSCVASGREVEGPPVKRVRWIPLYADHDHVSGGFYSESADASQQPTELLHVGFPGIRSLVVGAGSFKRVRLLRLLDLPELTEVRIGKCSFTENCEYDGCARVIGRIVRWK